MPSRGLEFISGSDPASGNLAQIRRLYCPPGNRGGQAQGLEDKQIPSWMDYAKVPSLRTEARQKLTKIQPATLGQASRISGVSPSDIGILMVWMRQGPPVQELSDSVPL